MPERIEIEAVDKTYPGGARALTGVSLGIEAGEVLVLLGPSGSGKTTLLRCLAGIERISRGRVRIGQRVVADGRTHLPPERRNLAMVFQDYALWPHLVARDNVAFALRRRGMSGQERQAAALAMLDRVGLRALASRYPNQLSGGEQQRVALARALVGETGLLLCDEPLSNLDAHLRERLRIEISTLVRAAGATTVYITHDQAEAFALADRVGVLEHGQLIQLGTPEQIYRTPATPFVARFTGLSAVLQGRVYRAGPADLLAGPVRVLIPTTDARSQLALEASAMTPMNEGDAVQVMLRPTAARICRQDGRAASLRGVVRDSAFHGRGYHYVLEIGDGLALTGIFDRRRFSLGESVGVFIHPKGALVFPDDARQAGPRLAAQAVLPQAETTVHDLPTSVS